MAWLLRLLGVAVLAAGLSACSGGGSTPADPPEPPPPPPPAAEPVAVVVIDAARTTGDTSTEFHLEAVAEVENGTLDGFAWVLESGESFSGQTVDLNFATPGSYLVTLEASSGGVVLATAEISLIVHEAGDPTPDVLGLPDLMGDVNGDGQVSLADALLARQVLAGLREFPDDAAELAANLDMDAAFGAADVELLAQAVLDGAVLPTVLLDPAGYPGASITIISPALLNAADDVDVRIDGVSLVDQQRAILGYVTGILPLTLTGSGDVPVDVSVNGTTVASFTYALQAPVALPADAEGDLLQAFDDMVALMEAQTEHMDAELATSGLDDDQRADLLAMSRYAAQQAREEFDALAMIIAGLESEESVRLVLQSAYANGLAELREDLEGGSGQAGQRPLFAYSTGRVGGSLGFTPSEVCDDVVPNVCRTQRYLRGYTGLTKVVGGVCTLIGSAAIVAAASDGVLPVGDVVALLGWAGACYKVKTAMDWSAILPSLIGDVRMTLQLEASSTSLSAGETAELTALIRFFGAEELCRSGSSTALQRLITKKITNRVIASFMRNPANAGDLARIFALFGSDAYVNFFRSVEDAVSEVVGKAISQTGLVDLLSSFAGSMCDALYSPDQRLVADSRRIIQSVAANEGVLLHNADGTASYSCPPAGPVFNGNVTIVGQFNICGKVQTQSVNISCQVNAVTITMGDNGSATDDIFEVRVDGVTVLTTSSPVTRTSTTLQLSQGQHRVEMLGRAAPDGIGTYFISFSGAAVVSGPALSGSDLVPGVVKTWIIEVL